MLLTGEFFVIIKVDRIIPWQILIWFWYRVAFVIWLVMSLFLIVCGYAILASQQLLKSFVTLLSLWLLDSVLDRTIVIVIWGFLIVYMDGLLLCSRKGWVMSLGLPVMGHPVFVDKREQRSAWMRNIYPFVRKLVVSFMVASQFSAENETSFF